MLAGSWLSWRGCFAGERVALTRPGGPDSSTTALPLQDRGRLGAIPPADHVGHPSQLESWKPLLELGAVEGHVHRFEADTPFDHAREIWLGEFQQRAGDL